MSEELRALSFETVWCVLFEDVEEDGAEEALMNAIADAEIMEILMAIVLYERVGIMIGVVCSALLRHVW
jgi:hypothetical protein